MPKEKFRLVPGWPRTVVYQLLDGRDIIVAELAPTRWVEPRPRSLLGTIDPVKDETDRASMHLEGVAMQQEDCALAREVLKDK
jgi:hypothetical protein